jgi:hypothetical protein
MEIEVKIPMERDSWDSYPGTFTFTVTDRLVMMEIVEYDYDRDKEARIIAFTKEEFLKLLRVVQL